MIDILKPLFGKFTNFAQNKMGFDRPPRLFLKQDTENAKSCLGKTAHYDPVEKAVTVFISGRHPKDILRSFAHELVHHTQNLRGDLSPEKCGDMGPKYAQENPHMRKMEEEAYLVGNMCFRDWEDSEKFSLQESRILKENKTMTTKITKESLKEMIRANLTEKLNEGGASPGGIRRMSPDQAREVAAAQIGSLGDEDVIGLAKMYKTTGANRNEMEANILQKAGTVAGGKGFNDLVQFIADVEDPIQLNRESKTITKESLKEMIRNILEEKMNSEETIEEEEEIEEQSRTDRTDRVAGRDAGGRRLDEEEEDCPNDDDDPMTEESENDDSIEEDKSSTDLDGTPEREENLYEARFTKRNTRLYEDLVKKWTK